MIIYNVSFSRQRKTWQNEKKGLALRSPFFALKNIKRGFLKTKGYRREIREYVWSVYYTRKKKGGNIMLLTFVWLERKTMKVIMAHPMSIHMKMPTLA